MLRTSPARAGGSRHRRTSPRCRAGAVPPTAVRVDMRLAVRARAVAACPRRVLGTGARGSWEPRHEAPTSVCNDTSLERRVLTLPAPYARMEAPEDEAPPARGASPRGASAFSGGRRRAALRRGSPDGLTARRARRSDVHAAGVPPRRGGPAGARGQAEGAPRYALPATRRAPPVCTSRPVAPRDAA